MSFYVYVHIYSSFGNIYLALNAILFIFVCLFDVKTTFLLTDAE